MASLWMSSTLGLSMVAGMGWADSSGWGSGAGAAFSTAFPSDDPGNPKMEKLKAIVEKIKAMIKTPKASLFDGAFMATP